MVNFLNPIPTWLIMLGSAILIYAMNELGFRLGHRKGPGLESQDPSNVVQGAAFTILALLLGFSFALALGRYDARRAALVREATAIGTTFLRAKLLDPKTAAIVRSELRAYVAERVEFARADAQPQQRAAAQEGSIEIQRDLWARTTEVARKDARSTIIPLFVSSLNDMINLSIEEAAVLGAQIPDIVIFGILLIAFIASGMMGYGFGRQGQRAIIFKILFALVLALALGLVLDLDRPQRGLIRVSLTPLLTAQHLMQATSP
jgi:hypothetical protein